MLSPLQLGTSDFINLAALASSFGVPLLSWAIKTTIDLRNIKHTLDGRTTRFDEMSLQVTRIEQFLKDKFDGVSTN